MDNIFKVTVNTDLKFDISKEDISKMDVLQTSQTRYHILQENKSFHAQIIAADFNEKKYTVKINNGIYEVDISDGLDVLIQEMGFSLASSKNVTSIEAPMPGLILDINVKAGQTVKQDDPLLILEAMKMENIITSPRDGTIKAITVTKGDAVDKKQLLLEFE
ncbi:MAG: acetyl-CoA carboxylase biotin carboxyl carrier protein subunit [Saonia sp.]